MTDHQIVELYWQRSEDAIQQTSDKYEAYLTQVAYNILADREDSRESVNDTYLAAWNSMPPQRPGILSTYLGKITRQIAIDVFRKRKSKKRKASEYALSLSELEDVIPDTERFSPDSVLDAELLGDAISCFLRTLNDDARNLFIGRYFFFDPLKEAASYCGMSEARAKSLLFRTRRKLKDYLEKEGFEI